MSRFEQRSWRPARVTKTDQTRLWAMVGLLGFVIVLMVVAGRSELWSTLFPDTNRPAGNGQGAIGQEGNGQEGNGQGGIGQGGIGQGGNDQAASADVEHGSPAARNSAVRVELSPAKKPAANSAHEPPAPSESPQAPARTPQSTALQQRNNFTMRALLIVSIAYFVWRIVRIGRRFAPRPQPRPKGLTFDGDSTPAWSRPVPIPEPTVGPEREPAPPPGFLSQQEGSSNEASSSAPAESPVTPPRDASGRSDTSRENRTQGAPQPKE